MYPIECKPDIEESLDRVSKWLNGEAIDRPPVRFSRHNSEFDGQLRSNNRWDNLKERWFDTEYQLDYFENVLSRSRFHGETFPVFWPNLGPNVLAACYGCRHEYGEVTAWAEPSIFENEPPYKEIKLIDGLPQLDWESEYIKKLDEMTQEAIRRANNKYLVGYTDLHPGLDLIAALRGTEQLLFDVYDNPEDIIKLNNHFHNDFIRVFDRYDSMLKNNNQLSVTWLNIPSHKKLHIPSCDFASMISCEQFNELAYDGLANETKYMDHNIFHVDGPGVARHIDQILQLPNLNAIQWVQGVAEDAPIMQWVPFVKKVQRAGKGIIVDLSINELDEFMESVDPQGIYLCVATKNEQEELDIINALKKW